MRTRYWSSDHGSSTAVQVRDDTTPKVFVHTNLGWLPISNAPTDWDAAFFFAQEIADGYRLTERDQATAIYFATGERPLSAEELAEWEEDHRLAALADEERERQNELRWREIPR